MSKTKQIEEKYEVEPKQEAANGEQNAGLLDKVVDRTADGDSIKFHQGIGTVNQGTQLRDCPTSLDLTTSKHKAWAVNASGESDYTIDRDKPCEINATAFILMPGEAIDEETGELKQFTWLVLFDNDGKFVKTTSQVMPKRVAQLLSVYSKEEWASGIRCMLVERKSRKSGRIYHDLRVVPE
jgi:hypothetical protein